MRNHFPLIALGLALAFVSCSTSIEPIQRGTAGAITVQKHGGKIVAPLGALWTSAAYGNDRFVATALWPFSGGTTGKVAVSTDGLNWTTHDVEGTPLWSSVSFGNGVFVMVAWLGSGSSPVSASSSDGVNWTLGDLDTTDTWESVAFGNGLFVASGEMGTATSTDGVHWTPTQGSGWWKVEFVGGRFIVPSNAFVTGTLSTSLDGSAWTPLPAPSQPAIAWTSFAAGNNTTVALAGGNSEAATLSGSTWTVHSLPQNAGWRLIAFGDGKFFAVGDGKENNVGLSSDGANWVPLTVSDDSSYKGQLIFGNHRFLSLAQDGTVGVYEIH